MTGLGPDPDDPDWVDLGACEEVRRQRARGAGPQIREVAVVEEHRLGETGRRFEHEDDAAADREAALRIGVRPGGDLDREEGRIPKVRDRKSTRLNSSHGYISYAVFCLKKKKTKKQDIECI